MAFGIITLLLFLTGASSNSNEIMETIKTKHFQLMNNKGDSIIELFSGTNGGNIVFLNQKGKPVSIGGAFPNGGSWGAMNNNGVRVAYLGSEEMGGFLVLSDHEGKDGVSSFASKDGRSIQLTNRNNKDVVFITCDNKGEGRISLKNSNGQLIKTIPSP